MKKLIPEESDSDIGDPGEYGSLVSARGPCLIVKDIDVSKIFATAPQVPVVFNFYEEQ